VPNPRWRKIVSCASFGTKEKKSLFLSDYASRGLQKIPASCHTMCNRAAAKA
jgi:hypothetical protein